MKKKSQVMFSIKLQLCDNEEECGKRGVTGTEGVILSFGCRQIAKT